jgi:hypothetical protein
VRDAVLDVFAATAAEAEALVPLLEMGLGVQFDLAAGNLLDRLLHQRAGNARATVIHGRRDPADARSPA